MRGGGGEKEEGVRGGIQKSAQVLAKSCRQRHIKCSPFVIVAQLLPATQTRHLALLAPHPLFPFWPSLLRFASIAFPCRLLSLPSSLKKQEAAAKKSKVKQKCQRGKACALCRVGLGLHLVLLLCCLVFSLYLCPCLYQCGCGQFVT